MSRQQVAKIQLSKIELLKIAASFQRKCFPSLLVIHRNCFYDVNKNKAKMICSDVFFREKSLAGGQTRVLSTLSECSLVLTCETNREVIPRKICKCYKKCIKNEQFRQFSLTSLVMQCAVSINKEMTAMIINILAEQY